MATTAADPECPYCTGKHGIFDLTRLCCRARLKLRERQISEARAKALERVFQGLKAHAPPADNGEDDDDDERQPDGPQVAR